jgi:ribosome-binding factor A
MSNPKQQVEAVLKRAISSILLSKISDPRIQGMLSITSVEVTEDFSEAFVSVSVLPDRLAKRTLYGLRHAAGHIHALLCKAVDMRSVPKLQFKIDSTLKKQDEIFQAIQKGMAREPEVPTPGLPPFANPVDPSNPPDDPPIQEPGR